MISELYVPRDRFTHFMAEARRSVQETGANVVYGTVRLIEAEDETFLRWAKRDFACIIFNLLVEHSPAGIERGQAQFQALIDCALNEGGCYYLTYHRWARQDQVERAYPEFREFLDLKDQYDPYGFSPASAQVLSTDVPLTIFSGQTAPREASGKHLWLYPT